MFGHKAQLPSFPTLTSGSSLVVRYEGSPSFHFFLIFCASLGAALGLLLGINIGLLLIILLLLIMFHALF